MLTRRRHEPRQPPHQPHGVQDEGGLATAGGTSKLQAYALIIQQFELLEKRAMTRSHPPRTRPGPQAGLPTQKNPKLEGIDAIAETAHRWHARYPQGYTDKAKGQ